jgi:hypothetical protein
MVLSKGSKRKKCGPSTPLTSAHRQLLSNVKNLMERRFGTVFAALSEATQ